MVHQLSVKPTGTSFKKTPWLPMSAPMVWDKSGPFLTLVSVVVLQSLRSPSSQLKTWVLPV